MYMDHLKYIKEIARSVAIGSFDIIIVIPAIVLQELGDLRKVLPTNVCSQCSPCKHGRYRHINYQFEKLQAPSEDQRAQVRWKASGAPGSSLARNQEVKKTIAITMI